MSKKIEEMTAQELETRQAEIVKECETAEGDALKELEAEATRICERKKQLAAAEKRQAIREMVANGAGSRMENPAAHNENEERAQAFKETRRETIGTVETRAVLVSGGTLLTPTGVSGINDSADVRVSSIIDMVKVVNCEGMGSNKIAYLSADADEADNQTEGSAAAEKEPTFATITITPESVATLA